MNDQYQQAQDKSQNSDAYVNYYGLTGDPFISDSPLFFTTPQLEKMLRLFNYLARFSRKLVLVTGDGGAGKTALLEHFVNEQDAQDLVCFFAALNTDTPQQVLHEIADQLGATDSESLEQLIKEIRDYSQQRLDHGKNCIVVIDDAHLLVPAVLEQLYQLTLDEGQRCAIRLLLCGQDSLLEMMQAVVPAEVATNILFHQKISPLSYDETVQYLAVHFKENAGHSKVPFTDSDYQQIYQQSGGLPGRVNELAKLALTEGASRVVASPDSSAKSKGLMALLAIVLLTVGGVYWWQNAQQETDGDDVAQSGVTGQIDRVDDMPIVGEHQLAYEQIFTEPEDSSKAELILGPLQAEPVTTTDPLEPALNLETRQNSAVIADEEIPSRQVKEVAQAEQEALPDDVVANAVALKITSEQARSEAQLMAATKTESASEQIQQQGSEEPIILPVSRLMRDAERILAFPRSEYTMQLLGSHKEQNIQDILAKLPADKNLLYFKKTHKGAPWYVLIYGHYADRASVNKAAKKLPAALKGIKPWIRGVSGIQKTIKANQ